MFNICLKYNSIYDKLNIVGKRGKFMKKIIITVCLIALGLPALTADSQSAESIRYYNSSGASDKQFNYYGLNKTTNPVDDESEVLLDPPAKAPKRVVKQIKVNDEDEDISTSRKYEEAMDKRTPMTYEQFPKNYDSSNSMMMMQGGMGGMMMPGMF